MKCIACGKEADHELRSLMIETMHLRGLDGDKPLQRLGKKVETTGVCSECAEKYLKAAGAGGKRVMKKYLIFGLILLVGALVILAGHTDRVFLTTGIAAVFCGLAGLVTEFLQARTQKKEFDEMSDEKRYEKAAWQVFLQHASKKSEDEYFDRTYMPVNDETRHMIPGDLMVLYKIEPVCVKKMMRMIHNPQGIDPQDKEPVPAEIDKQE